MRTPAVGDRAPLPADPSECPPLPDDARATLAAGLAALGIAGPGPGAAGSGAGSSPGAAGPGAGSSPGAAGPGLGILLEGHLRLLLAWTGAINLTGVRDPVAAVTAHVLDSLTALPLLREAGVDVLLDLGSGGGYPGLALAAALPVRHALLVDSVAKKVRFLDTVIGALGLRESVGAAAIRAEDLAADRRHREAWQAVTARGVAALPELVELAFPLLAPGGLLVAWKRGDIAEERRRALPAIAALGGGSLDVHPVPAGLSAFGGLALHRLVVVAKSGRTGSRWPRSPADRRSAPW